MFQKGIHDDSSLLATRTAYPLSAFSLRDTITATLIREEAAESLLPEIQGDAELAALDQMLNRYHVQWWLKHLTRVGADPARYWRKHLGEEIKAATRGKSSPSRKKMFPWWFFRSFTNSVKYQLSDLKLDPL